VNLIELMVVLTIIGFFLTASVTNFTKVFDIDLTKHYIETALYAGLWKSELYKVYDKENCVVFPINTIYFKRPSEMCLSNIEVLSFRWVKGGTYSGIAVEPILFKISGGEK